MLRTRSAALLGACLLAACTTSHPISDAPYEPPESGARGSARIGPEGGTVEVGGVVLTVPPDALPAAREISVTVITDDPPSGFRAFTPVLRFEPAGLTFDRPARVSIPFGGDSEVATVFWTRAGGGGYVALDTEVAHGVAHAEVTHFSHAFVGSGCVGEGCCRRASSELDLLMMVDNSNSMDDEQELLAAQLPRVARVLASGDLDGDGSQDFPAVASLHIGVVTSDMGSGGFMVPTCHEPDFGDDGILRTAGNTSIPGCVASHPAFQEYRDDAGADPDAFADDVACVARVGTGGCGFEQPLESTLKALVPSSAPIEFAMATRGHADRENAGFVRPNSILAALVVADEDDCSAGDPALYDPSTGEELNARCLREDAGLHAIGRYVHGLASLRPDPSMLVFAAVTGVPQDRVTEVDAVDYDGLLSDERMAVRWEPSGELAPACEAPSGSVATPARRIVQTAQELERAGASGIVQSICQEDWTPVLDAILREVAARLAGSCR